MVLNYGNINLFVLSDEDDCDDEEGNDDQRTAKAHKNPNTHWTLFYSNRKQQTIKCLRNTTEFSNLILNQFPVLTYVGMVPSAYMVRKPVHSKHP